MMRPRAVELPSPRVRFGPDFLGRLGRLTGRLASLRERREGGGGARLFGVGAEFVAHRPYRSGEDLRGLDWNLLARLRRPYVRVAAREASESWGLVLDTSASMGTGRPGKLQLAAEVALGFAALAVQRRAAVELLLTGPAESLRLRRRGDLTGWLRRLEDCPASGSAGLGALASDSRLRRHGRLVLVGDFLDCGPRDLLALATAARELVLVQILAREELAAPPHGIVRWIDAESGAERTLRVDASAALAYERRLQQRLDAWRTSATRARAFHGLWTSDAVFEDVVQASGA